MFLYKVILFSEHKNLIICSDKDANGGRSFYVDVICIYDPRLYDILNTMPASVYFESNTRTQLEQENPSGLEIFHLHIIPCKAYEPITIPIRKKKLINCIIMVDFKQINQPIVRKIITGDETTLSILFNAQGIAVVK